MSKILLLCASTIYLFSAHAEEQQGKLIHNYDYGCFKKNTVTKFGILKNVTCNTLGLDDISKLYLNEKLILEFNNYIMLKNIEDSYFIYESTMFRDKNIEKVYFLIDFRNNPAKVYQFGVKNIYSWYLYYAEKDKELKVRINGEIEFNFKDGKVSYPSKIVDLKKYFGEQIYEVIDSKETKEELYKKYSPYVEETEIDLNDPKIKSNKEFPYPVIYQEKDQKYIKKYNTPLGEVILTDKKILQLKNKQNQFEQLSTNDLMVMATNENNSLILGYLGYYHNTNVGEGGKNCGQGLVMFDFNGSKVKATSFGVSDGCDKLKKIEFIGKNAAKIILEPNIEFTYKDGKIELPTEKDYYLNGIVNNRYTKEDDSPINSIHEIQQILKKDPMREEKKKYKAEEENKFYFKYFPPYFREEEIPIRPYYKYSRVFLTQHGTLLLENFEEDIEETYRNNEGKWESSQSVTRLRLGDKVWYSDKGVALNLLHWSDDRKYFLFEERIDVLKYCVPTNLLFDLSGEKAKLIRFGMEGACNNIEKKKNNFSNVNYNDLKIVINNSIFQYKNGELIKPIPHKNAIITLPYDPIIKGLSAIKKYPVLVEELKEIEVKVE